MTFIFRFHKADTFRKLLPIIAVICLYSGAIAWLEMEYWILSENSHVKNIPIMHGMLGFVISLLLVFRTNIAYDRWWEGRKLWLRICVLTWILCDSSGRIYILCSSFTRTCSRRNRRAFRWRRKRSSNRTNRDEYSETCGGDYIIRKFMIRDSEFEMNNWYLIHI